MMLNVFFTEDPSGGIRFVQAELTNKSRVKERLSQKIINPISYLKRVLVL